jgi:hypothetical protein
MPTARLRDWMVAACLGTESIAAGLMLAAWLRLGLGLASGGRTLFSFAAPALASVFLGLTLVLAASLQRPDRVWHVLLTPNGRSWWCWGAWIHLGYGVLLAGWVGVWLLV